LTAGPRLNLAVVAKQLRFRELVMKTKVLMVAATIVTWFGFGIHAAKADETHCYTVASLKGTYATVATYGAHVAVALGVRHFDGEGNLRGTFTVNEPTSGSTTGARTIVTGTHVGTYTVNCDGTGVFTRTLTASNGVTTTQTDDFVITKATMQEDGRLIATALEDAQRTPSAIVAGGIFLTRSYTRRPD
jgi:hypothetical protein